MKRQDSDPPGDPQKEQIRRFLADLPETDRKLLLRYYVQAQPREFIQSELGLAPEQFRLIKARARVALLKIMRKR